jgi:hypothetical protein
MLFQPYRLYYSEDCDRESGHAVWLTDDDRKVKVTYAVRAEDDQTPEEKRAREFVGIGIFCVTPNQRWLLGYFERLKLAGLLTPNMVEGTGLDISPAPLAWQPDWPPSPEWPPFLE